MNRPLLTPGFSLQDIAAATGVSLRTVLRWLAQGLPFVQPIPGGRVFVRQEDLDRFLQPRQHTAVVVNHLIDDVMAEIGNKAGRGRP